MNPPRRSTTPARVLLAVAALAYGALTAVASLAAPTPASAMQMISPTLISDRPRARRSAQARKSTIDLVKLGSAMASM